MPRLDKPRRVLLKDRIGSRLSYFYDKLQLSKWGEFRWSPDLPTLKSNHLTIYSRQSPCLADSLFKPHARRCTFCCAIIGIDSFRWLQIAHVRWWSLNKCQSKRDKIIMRRWKSTFMHEGRMQFTSEADRTCWFRWHSEKRSSAVMQPKDAFIGSSNSRNFHMVRPKQANRLVTVYGRQSALTARIDNWVDDCCGYRCQVVLISWKSIWADWQSLWTFALR